MPSDFIRGILKRIDPRLLWRDLEDWEFDRSRRVNTSGNEHTPAPERVVGELRDSHIYGPVRVPSAHAALRALPLKDMSEYTFIDIGSGKGRMLFVAAEYPFRRVLGVEFGTDLHNLANENIARYRHPKRRSGPIESLNENAATFEFPQGKLVLYMFNPFGPEILSRMLDNLQQSLEREPRHVVLLMVWPDHSDVVARRPWLREVSRTRRYHVFETFTAGG